MARRRTIGESPLDVVVPPGRPGRGRVLPPATPEARVVKERITIHLPVELIERMKNTVYWTPGLTLAGLVEAAVEAAVAELEAERGQPFPRRRQELHGGRPLK